MRCPLIDWIYYKYEEGIFYDTCYERENGRWVKAMKAENRRCFFEGGDWVDFYETGASYDDLCQRKDKSGKWVDDD